MGKIFNLITILLVLLACKSPKEQDDESLKDAVKVKYKVDGFNLAIQIPENWKVETDSANMLIFKERCSSEVIFCPNIVIRTVNNTDSLTVDQIVNIYVQNFERRFEEMKLVSVTDTEIGGQKSKVIDYKVFENKIHLGSTAVFMLREGKILSFNFSAENRPEGNYASQRKIFFEILSSVEL